MDWGIIHCTTMGRLGQRPPLASPPRQLRRRGMELAAVFLVGAGHALPSCGSSQMSFCCAVGAGYIRPEATRSSAQLVGGIYPAPAFVGCAQRRERPNPHKRAGGGILCPRRSYAQPQTQKTTLRPIRAAEWGEGDQPLQSMVFSSLSFLIMATASSKEMVPRLSPLRLRMVTVRFSASRSPSTNM